MFSSNASLVSESTSHPESAIAIQILKQLSGTDKETLITLAGYAWSDDREVMQVLVNKLINLLAEPHNKWVFAAIGASCCASILSDARHFTVANSSLPVKLLKAVIKAMGELHKGRQPDIETLRLALLALNATLDILLANAIGELDKVLYAETKKLLGEINSMKRLPATVLFLSEHASLGLKAIGKQYAVDSNKSVKGQFAEGSLNFLLGTVLVGAGITGFAASLGATAATGGLLAPVAVAGAFSFFVSAGFATERYYSSLKSLKKIYIRAQEQGYFKDISLDFLSAEEETDKNKVMILRGESVHWERAIVDLISNAQGSLKPFETKQLVFTLFRLLETDDLDASYTEGLTRIIKSLYSQNLSKEKGATGVRQFILEQIQALSTRYDLMEYLAKLKGDVSSIIANQDKRSFQEKLTKEFVQCCNNVEKSGVVYGAIDFKPKRHSADLLGVSTLIEDMNQLQLEDSYAATQVGLASQRHIQKVRLWGQRDLSACVVIPAEPDGNCGFSAISSCLDILRPDAISPETVKKINRASFIETVQTHYLDEEISVELKALMENMFEEDGCNTLDTWCEKFKPSSLYVGESHLKVLSHLYSLVFHVYFVSEETNQFEPEERSETIRGFKASDESRVSLSIHLAHIVAGLRGEDAHQNHFEGLIIEPTDEQKKTIYNPMKDNILLKKANKDLAPFIEGHALLHPHAVSHADEYTGSAVNGFKSLTLNPNGFIDKSEFLLAILAIGDNKAILRPRRSGKSMLFSMANQFFSVLHKETSHALFYDLNVATHYPDFYEYHRGRYPVLLLDMKDIVGRTYKDTIDSFKLRVVKKSYNNYLEVLSKSSKLFPDEKKTLVKYCHSSLTLSDAEAIEAIEQLTQWLYRHYGEEVLIFVDEYDAPLIKALQAEKPYYLDLKEFIVSFFSSAFKTRESLKTAVFTGIMNAKGAGIFSELNNVTTYTYLEDNHFGPYVGFTLEEVEEYLKLNKLYSDTLVREMQKFFNGYICLGRSPEAQDRGLTIAGFLFNTFSVERCVMEQGLVRSYWIRSSSSHQLIVDVIKRAESSDVENQILELTGEYLHHELCEKKSVIKNSFKRGIYLYLEEGQLAAGIVHNDYLFEFVKLNDVLDNEFDFPADGQKVIHLDDSIIDKILSQCEHKEAKESFSIYSPLTLTNLDFLVKTHKNTAEDIYCLLFYAGYLTFTGRRKDTDGLVTYELKIPNEEIRLMFRHEILPKIKEQQKNRALKEQRSLLNYRVEHSGNSPHGFYSQPQREQRGIIQQSDNFELLWNADCPQGFEAFKDEDNQLYVVKIENVDADIFDDEILYAEVQNILHSKNGAASRACNKERTKKLGSGDIIVVCFEEPASAIRCLEALSEVIKPKDDEEKTPRGFIQP